MYVSPAAAPAGLYITFTSFYIQNSSESAATIMIFIEKTQPPQNHFAKCLRAEPSPVRNRSA
ncbi:hypothetical protein DOX53_19525 [Cronobacter malonaticus]|uniref:Uncharacterized protein n=1 Tax=Cronobacter malonaticus TaxID=413503 RepID=A0ABX5JZ35_9ENTR|nr:hypothetical protein [Cronobacter malonaticus]EGT4287743.1 hypothetical protein [Cronobacter malonaticus]EGT4295484.1 hypothetical protein [Cronobacter malonaticus]EGT4312084.1 hypothetical protein [Cronobacter malonaticus]EGT4336056.1 hypothetical protein [Cronobacter malonaticus]